MGKNGAYEIDKLELQKISSFNIHNWSIERRK